MRLQSTKTTWNSQYAIEITNQKLEAKFDLGNGYYRQTILSSDTALNAVYRDSASNSIISSGAFSYNLMHLECGQNKITFDVNDLSDREVAYMYISGKASIGTLTESYALNVASFICDSWIRTTGATGWYNQTYNGGWYMTDSSYIRSYNNKSILVNNSIFQFETENTSSNAYFLQRYNTSGSEYQGGLRSYPSGTTRVGIYNATSASHISMIDFSVDGSISIRPNGTTEMTFTNDNVDVSTHMTFSNTKQLISKDTAGDTTTLIYLNSGDNIHISGTSNSANGKSVYIHNTGSYGVGFIGSAFRPDTTNVLALGSSSYKWTAVYATNGTIQTSDRNKKKNIEPIPEIYEELFLKTQCVSYMFKDGDRIHIGVISQDFEEMMTEIGLTALDFAGFCKDIHYEYDIAEDGTEIESTKRPATDENGDIIYDYSFRYQEFIMLTAHMVQKTIRRADAQEQEIENLKTQISTYAAILQTLCSQLHVDCPIN